MLSYSLIVIVIIFYFNQVSTWTSTENDVTLLIWNRPSLQYEHETFERGKIFKQKEIGIKQHSEIDGRK